VKRVWLVIPDPLSARIFFDTGIFGGLRERLGERLVAALTVDRKHAANWAAHLDGVPAIYERELFPWQVPIPEKVKRRLDIWLDRKVGFYPIAIRFNERHGFHRGRMRPGHDHLFLNSSLAGPLPRWASLDEAMRGWVYSPHRYVSHTLLERMRRECAALVLANVQTQPVVRFLLAARRLGVPSVGYVLSWDHTVGKGVISTHLDRYLVQNDVMRDELARYHGVDSARVVVTGWPQSDVFHRRRPRADYDELLRQYELDPAKPVMIVMGNTPTNAPYEDRFVKRLVDWWESTGGAARFSLLFRPHPTDLRWEDRFAAALGRPGAYVQASSYTDLDVLATMLQHADCIVANAGTILLDSIVNDRPSVCVLYDEGGPPGESWAAKNVEGEHYRQLMESGAFYRANDFDEVALGIEHALAHPEELAAERRHVAREVVGEVDGRAAERVVGAIVEVIGP
jgi:hypothetical protein